MLPCLQRVAKGMQQQDFWMLMVLHFVFLSLFPLINILLSFTNFSTLDITGDFSVPIATMKVIFYPLLGYYLENHVNIKKLSRVQLGGIGLAALMGIVFSCLCTLLEGHLTGSYTQNYVQLFDYVSTIFAFIAIKRITTVSVPALSRNKIGQAVCLIGSLTFGMYLFDPYLKRLIEEPYNVLAEPYLPTLFVSIGWCLIRMILGGIITYAIKKISLFNKLI